MQPANILVADDDAVARDLLAEAARMNHTQRLAIVEDARRFHPGVDIASAIAARHACVVADGKRHRAPGGVDLFGELRAGLVNRDRLPLHEDAWPESVLQINNNIRNQFELPVLFYVLAFLLWALHAVHALALVVASTFVLSRVAHAWIHIRSNYMPARRKSFTVGWFLLAALALLVAFELGRRAFGYGPT